MQTRLLGFLVEIERAVRAERPQPMAAAEWETARSVNYGLGLARLTLGARTSTGELHALGGILLQSFRLADGMVCLRATLTWQDSGSELSHPIYAKPLLNWDSEASRLASTWMSGPSSKPASIDETPELLAAG